MTILHHGAHRVNLRNAPYAKTYFVPNTPPGEKPRTAAIGYYDAGTLRSKRTSDGRRYDGDALALLISVLDEAAADGFTRLEIIVVYRKTQTQTTYATTIDYLRKHGRRVLGVSGWELAMPRSLWGIDGAAPVGEPEPAPVVEQPALFAFAEPARRGGAY